MPLALITCVTHPGALDHAENMCTCLDKVFSWAKKKKPCKHARVNAHVHTYATPVARMHVSTACLSRNSFIRGGSVYLACVMGRLIGGFSNYEAGKASGRGRQSDPSVLVWCISRAPTTADPIHMAINGVLYINVIPVLPHISAWITPTTNYCNPMFYWVQRCRRCKSRLSHVIKAKLGVIMFMNVCV